MLAADESTAGGASAPAVTSADGRAALATVPLRPTGGPAFGADLPNSFSGANVTLLAVTALAMALLLIVTYRSLMLWPAPPRRARHDCADQAVCSIQCQTLPESTISTLPTGRLTT